MQRKGINRLKKKNENDENEQINNERGKGSSTIKGLSKERNYLVVVKKALNKNVLTENRRKKKKRKYNQYEEEVGETKNIVRNKKEIEKKKIQCLNAIQTLKILQRLKE